MVWDVPLPAELEAFKVNAQEYVGLLNSEDNISSYTGYVGQKTTDYSKLAVIALPFFVALGFFIKSLYDRGNTKHNQDTIPLKLLRRYLP